MNLFERLTRFEEQLLGVHPGIEVFGFPHPHLRCQLGWARVWGKRSWGLAIRDESGRCTPLLDHDDDTLIAWSYGQIEALLESLLHAADLLLQTMHDTVQRFDRARPVLDHKLLQLHDLAAAIPRRAR